MLLIIQQGRYARKPIYYCLIKRMAFQRLRPTATRFSLIRIVKDILIFFISLARLKFREIFDNYA